MITINNYSVLSLNLLLFLLLIKTNVLVHSSEVESYCNTNIIPGKKSSNASGVMEFTKEAVYEEFAIVGQFKGLHCCAKGYRSIEWYKDDLKLYPWPLSVSQLILYPESGNQTLYTKSVTLNDAGNYTCILINDTHVHRHSIYLTVFEKVPDDPKITYISPNQNVAVGGKLRLFCEAFAGQVDLPDAYNDVVWYKLEMNGVRNATRVKQEKITRENGQTFGAYLEINSVRSEDFGQYLCSITKPGKSVELTVWVGEQVDSEILDANPVPVTKLIFIASAITFFVLVVAILYLKYGLKLRVHFKDRFSALESNDGKENDILLVYGETDADLVFGRLLPTLQSHFQYSCISKPLPPQFVNLWYSELQEDAKKCRRIVAVLSPATLNGNWTSAYILHAIKQLQALGPYLICINTQSMPTNATGGQDEVKNAQGETLASVLRTITALQWPPISNDHFWYNLRLHLPPNRIGLAAGNNDTLSSISTTDTLDSKSSCDASKRLNKSPSANNTILEDDNQTNNAEPNLYKDLV